MNLKAMKDQPDGRYFTIRDAKRVFPGLADGVVSKWKSKGLLSFKTERHGTSILIRYSIREILHLGVVNQLSLIGVLRADTQELFISWSPENPPCPMTDPLPIINAYDDDSQLEISVYEDAIEGAHYRNRRATPRYQMSLSTSRFLGPCFVNAKIEIGKMFKECKRILCS